MRAGGLDRQVTVSRKAVLGDPEYVAPDAVFGTQKVAWVPLDRDPADTSKALRFWARVIEVVPGRAESTVLEAGSARNLARIQLRYRADIDTTMMVTVHGDRDVDYQIIGGPSQIDREGRKTLIEILCERFN